MKCIIGVIVSVLLSSVGQADDLYLRSGFVFRNCLVTDTTDNRITIQTSKRVHRYLLAMVERVIKKPYDPNKETEYFRYEVKIESPKLIISFDTTSGSWASQARRFQLTETSYPNLHFLPLSFVAIGLSIDYFFQVSDLADAIESAEQGIESLPFNSEVESEKRRLESSKTRKAILGVVFALAAITNTVISLQTETVEIQVSSNTIGFKIYL